MNIYVTPKLSLNDFVSLVLLGEAMFHNGSSMDGVSKIVRLYPYYFNIFPKNGGASFLPTVVDFFGETGDVDEFDGLSFDFESSRI